MAGLHSILNVSNGRFVPSILACKDARMRVAVPVGTTLIGLALGILEIRWN